MGAQGVSAGMAVAQFGLSKADTDAQLASDKYSESQYRQNSYMAKLQAEDAIKRGDQEAAALARQTSGLIGAQRVGYAAQGIDVESGSALAVQEDTAALSMEDQMMLKANAFREAWGYKMEAESLSGQADMIKLAGKQAHRQGVLTGAFNAINTGMGIYGSMSKYDSPQKQDKSPSRSPAAQTRLQRYSAMVGNVKYDASTSRTGYVPRSK